MAEAAMTARPDRVPHVLIIDEVPSVVKLIQLELGFQGFKTEAILLDDGAVEKAEATMPDAIVLGSSIPFAGIYEVLMQLKRAVAIPVLFIYAGGNDNDAALALNMGADDVMASPYLPEELGMHLRALLGDDVPEYRQIRRAGLRIDPMHRVVWKGDQKMALGTNEWALLMALATESNTFQAPELLTMVWGGEYAGETKFLTTWIQRLRENLGDDVHSPHMILGDLSQGFRLGD
jgi:DNA-binding response OmpR family regulator